MYDKNITVEITNPAILIMLVSVLLHKFNNMFTILTSNTHNKRSYKTVVNLITLRLKLPLKTGVIALAWTTLSLKISWYVNISYHRFNIIITGYKKVI